MLVLFGILSIITMHAYRLEKVITTYLPLSIACIHNVVTWQQVFCFQVGMKKRLFKDDGSASRDNGHCLFSFVASRRPVFTAATSAS